MICKNCPSRKTCNSLCSINILPIGKGNGEDECPEYDNCKRIKKYNQTGSQFENDFDDFIYKEK
jgi:hypothetical protein